MERTTEHSSAHYQGYSRLPYVKFHFQLTITLRNFDPLERKSGLGMCCICAAVGAGLEMVSNIRKVSRYIGISIRFPCIFERKFTGKGVGGRSFPRKAGLDLTLGTTHRKSVLCVRKVSKQKPAQIWTSCKSSNEMQKKKSRSKTVDKYVSDVSCLS